MGVAPLRIHTVTLLARNGVINLFFFFGPLLASSAISFLSVSFLSSVGSAAGLCFGANSMLFLANAMRRALCDPGAATTGFG
jgi:hypothetical protein